MSELEHTLPDGISKGLYGVSEQYMEEVMNAFCMADTDCTLRLNDKKLKVAMGLLGFGCNRLKARHMIDRVSSSGDIELDYFRQMIADKLAKRDPFDRRIMRSVNSLPNISELIPIELPQRDPLILMESYHFERKLDPLDDMIMESINSSPNISELIPMESTQISFYNPAQETQEEEPVTLAKKHLIQEIPVKCVGEVFIEKPVKLKKIKQVLAPCIEPMSYDVWEEPMSEDVREKPRTFELSSSAPPSEMI